MWALWKVKNTENYKEMYLYSFINWRWVWRYLLPQIKMQGVEIVKVDKLKYLKYIQSNWKCVKKRVQADWSGWSVRRDVWLKYSSKSEREGLQDGGECCYDVWFVDCSTEGKTEAFLEAEMKMLRFYWPKLIIQDVKALFCTTNYEMDFNWKIIVQVEHPSIFFRWRLSQLS